MRQRAISEAARDRIVQLAKQGQPQASIALQLVAEGLVERISQGSVSKILSARKAGGEKILHRSRSDPRTAARRQLVASLNGSGPTPDPAPSSPQLPTVGPDDEDLGSVEHLRRRLAEVSGMIAEAKSAGQSGNPALFRDLVKLEADLTAKILALTPVAPPDPEQDPANLQARRALIAKVERLIQHEEQGAAS